MFVGKAIHYGIKREVGRMSDKLQFVVMSKKEPQIKQINTDQGPSRFICGSCCLEATN